jgi:hypothetical protein
VKAFVGLKEGADDQVLRILRGKSFVRSDDERYDAIRQVAEKLKMF